VKGTLGGKRPGAGRPTNAERFPTETEECIQLLRKNAVPLMEAQIALALGVKVLETDAEGNETVYRKPPDIRALDSSLNRFLGKVTDQVDVTSDGEPITFNSESERLSALAAFIDSIRNSGA
jgi:hypothetical protein